MSTYTPIAIQTLNVDTAIITFSSLPQNYTDLVLVINGNTNGDDEVRLRFNNDSGNNYSEVGMYGNGTSPAVTKYTNTNYVQLGGIYTSSGTGTNIIEIMSYANLSTYKTVLARANSGNYVQARVATWRGSNGLSTEAINRIDAYSASGTFSSGTTFTIYGISSGNSLSKASGGNIITTDGSYWYHAFTASGSFIPKESLTADILVIGGAGGGGAGHGGGGGAGGVLAYSSQSLLSETAYSCTIGSGGSGGTRGYSRTGFKGNPSQFSSLTSSLGGGGGGSYNNAESSSGASGGGGGGGKDYTSGSAGTQGYAGGNGTTNGTAGNGGGGGGAGGIGGNASGAQGSGSGGVGGNGINSVTNWGSLSNVLNSIKIGVSGYIAGGGGGGGWQTTGGAGGSGGGGAGYGYGSSGNTQTGYPGVANTGSGGGGGPDYNNGGGAGASGVIIIRYAV